MLHLYRIYNLHPVIHDNLRPEKPPKPFPRASVDEDGRVPRRRKAKGKGKEADEDVVGRWVQRLSFFCSYNDLCQTL